MTVRTIVHDVVSRLAPEELPIVAGLSGFDDDTVVARLSRRQHREPLGFGVDEAAALVTPAVWLAVDQAARRFGTVAANGATSGLKAAVRRITRRRSAPVVVPPLTTEQLAEVRRQVLESALQQGFKEQRAIVIADTVVARLALAPTADSPEPEPESESEDDVPLRGEEPTG
ncbi:hypothetical protein [Streptomyces sp. FH025]|uniref:hypothetical protein n=1 Tax=Streptomyces sp. FH025 TaxID=2815937 RepID=UPI001A9D1B60|nr:hypothetical protein [Streptomyces sp. FH025]MBO1415337.1 hypothetical protein [Streptomyces sp. FH025]